MLLQGLYEQNCIDRHYAPYSRNGWRILELHEQLVRRRKEALEARQRNNAIARQLKGGKESEERAGLLEEAKKLKSRLAEHEAEERGVEEEMERLGLDLPNLSSMSTPVGSQPDLLGHINGTSPPSLGHERSHVEIGRELDLLDFEASATTSGWGWYFLKNEAALLEQALIQYALSVAIKRGWTVMTPPSLVYGHIAGACGFQPRDQSGEQQIYNIASHHSSPSNGQPDDKPHHAAPGLVLAGTAEIPFAGSQANKTLPTDKLPLKVIGPSRCYRAEAGARGVDTKGLYRVHEFTKVEMFAWTTPPPTSETGFGADDASPSPSEEVFEEMVGIQKEILTNLGLHARILEMPSHDLGASATRKIDIEAFFPSRVGIDEGYGEVTSASICGDYQARRLNTRVKGSSGAKGGEDGKGVSGFAETVNGTAMAVPRVLAALLENGWDPIKGFVTVPRVLRKWMPGEIESIRPRGTAKTTHGDIDFHNFLSNKWTILFSHPADFTPVCTTELGAFAKMREEFDRRNVQMIGLSANDLGSHGKWIDDINEISQTSLQFPIIADADRNVAWLYDMINQEDLDNVGKGIAFTIRSVFIIDPSKKIRLTMMYPASTGRNTAEVLRVIDSLQTGDQKGVTTPIDWQVGEDVIVPPSVSTADAQKKFGDVREVKPYLRYTKV
ncbi:seryl-tRNA synthetase [Hortaea werneckii]|nr:seryl-tRNA synthetase [Hortaea werneckii]